MNLRRFRIISQVIFAGLFVYLLFKAAYPLPSRIPVDIFLRLDPLVALTAMIAARSIITIGLVSIILLLLTALVGRFFCAYICPLGSIIDFFDFILFKRYRAKKDNEPTSRRWWKYVVLMVVLLAAVLGLNLVFWFDPISMVTRIYTIVLIPPVMWLANMGLGLAQVFSVKLNIDSSLTTMQLRQYYFIFNLGITILFLVIMGLSIIQSRFWCGNLCPLGAWLSFFSRWGIFKRTVVRENCRNCHKCRTACPMRAIPKEVHRTVLAECTQCGTCMAACPFQGIKFVPRFSLKEDDTHIEVSRRNFISGLGAAVLAVSAARLNPKKQVADEHLIRPPGSLPEEEFLDRCVRCGECMKVCKTNCLQPAIMQSGWDGMWSPRAVFRIGGCEQKCNLCGQVCPTRAIRKLPLEEKQFVKMGTAVIDRSRCVAWAQNKLCLICDEICPYNAVEFKVVDDFTGPFKKPFVYADRCTGCGMCESKCPVKGSSAIFVLNEGEERFKTGSYITEQKKELRKITTNADESQGIVDFGDQAAPGKTAVKDTVKSKEKKEEVPAGFLSD